MTSTQERQVHANNRVALFIDVDNLLILAQHSGLPFRLSLIIDRVRQQGTIMSSKAYADWTASFLKPVLGDFRTNAIELVQLLTTTSAREHKNTADIQLAVDAFEMVFSPVRPDTIVIVGGDRDYVPLVQKLKRYGVFVMGIGVEAGVSRVLVEACDSYVYYDHIAIPVSEETTEPVSPPDTGVVYSLMRRAAEALSRESRASTGASVHAMMKQLAPDFDLERYQTTMKTLAHDAEKDGYVIVTENLGSDFTITAASLPAALNESTPELAKPEYDFSTPAAMTASYRTILQEHRIPLLPWGIRHKFIELIWDELGMRQNMGMSLDAMRELLLEHTYTEGLNRSVSPQMILKLLYSLNFARCFKLSKDAAMGYQIQIPQDVHSPLYPAETLEESINKIHRRYLEILAGEAALLDPEAVFDLLYGNEVTDEQEADDRREFLVKVCSQIKPMSPMGQALLDARRQR